MNINSFAFKLEFMIEQFAHLLTMSGIISLLTLIVMEIVLGIDNIIFISILAGKLPKTKQAKARKIGLSLALVMRIGLLFCITWITNLKTDIIAIGDLGFSGRDLVLLAGGLFLIAKSTTEIHGKIEGEEAHVDPTLKKLSLQSAIVQIILLDIVFSFDSILTAIGLVNEIVTMILAVIISMLVMLAAAKTVSDFVNNHPTIKMLALAFLLMIGFMLVVEAFDVHVPKGYIYFAMAFSLIVELLNQRVRKKSSKSRSSKSA